MNLEGHRLKLTICQEPVTLVPPSGADADAQPLSRGIKLSHADKILLSVIALWDKNTIIPYEALKHWTERQSTALAAKQALARINRNAASKIFRTDAREHGGSLDRALVVVDSDNVFDEWTRACDGFRSAEDNLTQAAAERLWPKFEAAYLLGAANPTRLLVDRFAELTLDTNNWLSASQIVSKWRDLHRNFRLNFAKVSFATGNLYKFRPAVKSLKTMAVAEGAPDDGIWETLITHLRESKAPDVNTWIRIYLDKCESEDVPVSDKIATPKDVTRWKSNQRAQASIAKRKKPVSPDTALAQIARRLGIAVSQDKGEMAPARIISKKPVQLLFAGTLATQWVSTRGLKISFENCLRRVDLLMSSGRRSNSEAPVRFLIMNPHSDVFEAFNEERADGVSTDHLGFLKRMASEHESFEINCFEGRPEFRLIVTEFGASADAWFARYPSGSADLSDLGDAGIDHFRVRRRSGERKTGNDEDILADLVRHCFEMMWQGSTALVWQNV